MKDVNFGGACDDKILSGSDDGNWFMWEKQTGELKGIWEGDDKCAFLSQERSILSDRCDVSSHFPLFFSVVNVIQPNPVMPSVLAVSGASDPHPCHREYLALTPDSTWDT